MMIQRVDNTSHDNDLGPHAHSASGLSRRQSQQFVVILILVVLLTTMTNIFRWGSHPAGNIQNTVATTRTKKWLWQPRNAHYSNKTVAPQDTTRQRILAQAKLQLQEYEQLYPTMNFTDLRKLMDDYSIPINSSSSLWTPTVIVNIVHARRYQEAAGNKNALVHFFGHIPKTGITHAAILLQRFVLKSPQYQQLNQALQQQEEQQIPSSGSDPAKHRYSRFRPCNIYLRHDFHAHAGSLQKTACTLWISETIRPPSTFQYSYTFIRNPKHHVVSQYYHCKESKEHQDRANFMPDTLQDWLQAWKYQMVSSANVVGQPNGNDPTFHCYDARNMQTAFSLFAQNYRNKTGNNTKDHLSVSAIRNDPVAMEDMRQDLEERFDILGLTDRTAQSTCMVALRYTGWIPPRCDCTNQLVPSRSSRSRQQITNTSNISLQGMSHGVQHHGASYSSSKTEEMLLDELTQWDQLLYEFAQESFWKRLIELEGEFGVRICDDLRTDVDDAGNKVVVGVNEP